MSVIPATRGNPQASEIAVQTALPMVGSASREDLQSTLGFADAELSKLFEDRNIMIADGGLISYNGTTVSFSQSLRLHINSKVAGGSPVIIDLGSSSRTVSANGNMIYAVINRTAGTATVTDDVSSLPAVTSSNQEVVLIAKRINSNDGTSILYFRDGSAFYAGVTARLGSPSDFYIHSTTLTANTTAVASSFTFLHATYASQIIDYSIKVTTAGHVRSGRLFVTTDGSVADIVDTYGETDNCDISWSVALNGPAVEISYTNGWASNNATMRAFVRRFFI